MSAYQYYEFLAVDRPLDDRQQAEVRSRPTRASITATSFVRVGAMIATRKPAEYDAVITLLTDPPPRPCLVVDPPATCSDEERGTG